MITQDTHTVWTRGKITALVVLSVLWFAGAAYIGSAELLANVTGSFFPPIALTAVAPVVLFLAAYLISARFREFVLGQDIETLTMLQHWRIIGFVFLVLYSFSVLPGTFAWPAGTGDILIGLAAPLMVMRLRREPDFATSKGLVRYHLLGLLDFAVAVTAAGLTAGAFPAFTPGGLTSAPMDVWPLNLFPSFIVPAFIIMHLTVLLKVRALRRETEHTFATRPLAA
ncbi:MAG: hypothetical protein AAF441_09245 [Pseudomonadota bacterium]